MAYKVAGVAVDYLRHAFGSVQMHDVAGAADAPSIGRHPLLIVSSTFGAGGLPRSAHAFRDAIQSQELVVRNLAYGIVCLGDRSFKSTFCGAGRHWNDLLTQSGARLKGRILNLDTGMGLFDEAEVQQWAQAWVVAVSEP